MKKPNPFTALVLAILSSASVAHAGPMSGGGGFAYLNFLADCDGQLNDGTQISVQLTESLYPGNLVTQITGLSEDLDLKCAAQNSSSWLCVESSGEARSFVIAIGGPSGVYHTSSTGSKVQIGQLACKKSE